MQLRTIVLLIISNTFMTVAWYGHLKYKKAPLVATIVVSWGIAFFEYIFQVPANRIGSNYFSLTQLKIMQECITLVMFTVFAMLIFREPLRWNNLVSYVLLIGAVGFAFGHIDGADCPLLWVLAHATHDVQHRTGGNRVGS